MKSVHSFFFFFFFLLPPYGISPFPSDVSADAVGDDLLHGNGADEVELVVQGSQVHGQLQVLLLHSPVADPAAAVAQPLRVVQVERQRAAGAGGADDVRAVAPARRRRGRAAGWPVGLGEEGGRVGLRLVAVALWRRRRRGSGESQGARWRHGGQVCFLLHPLLRLLPLTAVILERPITRTQKQTSGMTEKY